MQKKPKVIVKFHRESPYTTIPLRAHEGDIGMDLYATEIEYDPTNDSYIYHTGLSCETRAGVGICIFPRSSNVRTDCYLANSIGLVDSAQYRGEIKVVFKNRTSIAARRELTALRAWASLPWYKKLFTTYNDIYESTFIDPVAYSPYNIGERIAQLVVCEYPDIIIREVDALSKTERGTGGFGSTGK